MIAIPIKFEFNVESEIRRVKNTLNDIEWLNKNSYRFLLPSGIKDLKDIDVNSLRNFVENEYDSKSFEIAKEAIIKSWEGNSSFMKKINQKMIGSNILNEVTIVLTKYGTQGSYILPDSMIINISNIPPEFLIKTVIHESIHLMIEDLIKKYSIQHWVKERIVNLIMDVEYKSRFKMNPAPDWALSTDTIFKEFYPDMIMLVKKAAEISPKE